MWPPDFTADSSVGTIDLYNYLGDGWGVLFFHPSDFTPICTTELGTMVNLEGEFAKRNIKILAVSLDSAESHREWIRDINETQHANVKYSIIADVDK